MIAKIKFNTLKSLFLMIFIITLAACLSCDVKAAEKSEPQIKMDGYGSQEYPYLVTCIEDLENIRDVLYSGNSLQGKWFALTTDLDFEGKQIKPLADWGSGQSFWGGFDGRGHTISNFIIQTDTSPASFFGRIDGVIKNLILDGEIFGPLSASFATQGYGVILNCISNCDIKATEQACGIVNSWNGTLQNILFSGNLVAESISGIVSSGNGAASHIYSYDVPVGTIQTLGENAVINVGEQSNIVNVLNETVEQYFLTSSYGTWLNKWNIYDDRISFSEDLAAFAGSGSEDNPFVIDSAEKLQTVITYLNYGYSFDDAFLFQTEDIDLSNISWNFSFQNAVSFKGTYNGNGHTITGINADSTNGGLFHSLDGTILNLGLINWHTMFGCGFAGNIGDSALIINSFCIGKLGNYDSLISLMQSEQVINCYISDLIEPTAQELNEGLNNLVVKYGIHCGDLYLWSTSEKFGFGDNYEDLYFADERSYWSGSGVEKDPYLIQNLEDLVYLRESVHYYESFWRYWFLQTADIDFSDIRYWKAISDESAVASFKGIYNGNGFQITGFHQENASITHNGTIFGNLSGTVINLHIIDCKIQGMGNGVIAYNTSNTAKIMNNVIQVGVSDVNTTLSIVYSNSGKILNNMIVLPDTFTPFKIAEQESIVTDSEIEAEQLFNQILYTVTTNETEKFNENALSTALHLKQRITNFNLLTCNKNGLSLHAQVSAKSRVGIRFYLSMIKSNVILLIAVLWTIACIALGLVILLRKIIKKSHFQKIEIAQINITIAIYLIFVLVMQVYKSDVEWQKSILIGTFLVMLLFVTNTIWLIRYVKKVKKTRYSIDFKSYIFVILTFVITAAVSVAHFSTPVAYDSDLYYGSFIQAMENFNFTITGMLESFCIASKPMHGVAMLMAIGEVLSPGTGVGVYILNVVLLLISQFSVYKIIQKLFPDLSTYMRAGLALCFSFSGYVIAGATYINPDFYSVVTFAIFIYCWLYEYKIMSFYWGFMVLCSKPNMILAYSVFLVVFFLADLKEKKLNFYKWISYTVPVTVYLILYFGINSLNRAGIPAESNIEPMVTAGSRLLQYFAYGFIWIQEIFIIWALIYLIKNKRLHIFSSIKSIFLFGTWLACFAQLVILLLGGSILQLCPRYFAVCSIKNILLFAMALDVLPKLKQIKQFVLFIFGCLLFVQLFITIDPSIILTTAYKYDKLYYLVFPGTESDGNDLTFYNYEYAKDARTGSKILSKLNNEEIANLYSDSRSVYKLAIGNSLIYAAYWDTARNCRTYIRNDNCVRLRMTAITGGLSTRNADKFDDKVVIVRSSDLVFLKEKNMENWQVEKYDLFYVYTAK